jgi:hypothetical protein
MFYVWMELKRKVVNIHHFQFNKLMIVRKSNYIIIVRKYPFFNQFFFNCMLFPTMIQVHIF